MPTARTLALLSQHKRESRPAPKNIHHHRGTPGAPPPLAIRAHGDLRPVKGIDIGPAARPPRGEAVLVVLRLEESVVCKEEARWVRRLLECAEVLFEEFRDEGQERGRRRGCEEHGELELDARCFDSTVDLLAL